MKLWLFTFTSEDRQLSSARVAADSKAEACRIMGKALDRILIAEPFQHPEEGTIVAFFGEIDTDTPGIVSVIDLNGQEIRSP